MKVARPVAVLALAAGLIACGGAKNEDAAQKENDVHKTEMAKSGIEMAKGEKTIYYTCPMESHKHIHSEESGSCPECGMGLVAVVATDEEDAEFYTCPMPEHSHIRHSEAGKCEECGMKLVPVRKIPG